MKAGRAVVAISFTVLVSSAHIGSPDVWFEGNAGPYHVTIQVVPPSVVPGVAKIFVRVPASGIDQVAVQANRYDAIATAPPPEPAAPVERDPGLYSGDLWIMTGGSNSVTVSISGVRGVGKAVVPVVVVASRRLDLDPKFGFGLAAAGVFLFVGFVTIVGAAVRESTLPPGDTPDAKRRWKARTAMAIGTAIVAVALFGGARWWGLEDRQFANSIYKPLSAVASLRASGGSPMLELSLSDSTWVMRNDTAWLQRHRASRWSPLIPDHGKLVHLFMVREPDLIAFAHLHPKTTDSVTFESALPTLPAGTYRVYADIVHESGFNETLSPEITLDQPIRAEKAMTDADDAALISTVPPNDSVAQVGNDAVIARLHRNDELIAGVEAPLTFAIRTNAGAALRLEPYIGMAGHAVITRDDGSVFVHVHPSGTISMASQMAIIMRTPGDTVSGKLGQRISSSSMPSVAMPTDGVVSFPYAFPQPGRYHIWVQVKHAGRVLTGGFAFEVKPPPR